MFEASEALQKPEDTKKNKNNVVPLIFSEGPQKLEHKVDHDYFTVSAWKRLGVFF